MYMKGWVHKAALGPKTKEEQELNPGNLAWVPKWDSESFGVLWRVGERHCRSPKPGHEIMSQ